MNWYSVRDLIRRESSRLPPVRPLEHKLSREERLAAATAEDSRVQKVRVGDENISRIRRCCGYTGSTEYVRVADREVLVIEDVGKIGFKLKVS